VQRSEDDNEEDGDDTFVSVRLMTIDATSKFFP
jgi:hypothetical protein